MHCSLAAFLMLARSAQRGLIATVFILSAGTLHAQARYDYTVVGNPADSRPAQTPVLPTIMLMGGGSDVDAAFRWMITKSGGGDFVVLRASGGNGYDAYIMAMGGMDSVETLVVKNRSAAADAFVVDRVARAEALFIAGGDQADYVNLWKGTPLAAAIDGLISRKVPVGGSSAGLAVLGAFDFAALQGSIDSPEALANPYQRKVTLDRGFIAGPFLAGTITDPHFRQRDRMGRLVTFLARTVQDGWTGVATARAIGVDEATALVVEGGIGSRLGNGSVYLLRPTLAPAVCAARKPLTLRNIGVDKLSGAGRFDLSTWAAVLPGDTQRYDLSAENGRLLSSQPGGAVY